MPTKSLLGNPRLALRRIYTIQGQEFLTLTANRVNGRVDEFHGPKRPYNVQYGHYLGEAGWIAMEVRPGDRPYGDSTLVNRIGLDGWIDPVPNGDRYVHAKFDVVFGAGCAAVDSSNWLNIFEMHCFKLPGTTEYETSGPVRFSWEWSGGSAAPIFRVYSQVLVLDANGLATGSVQTIVYQTTALVEGVKYTFEIDFYSNSENGYLHVWRDGVQIVNINDAFVGYGVERRLYPTFRIYRANRSNTAKLLLNIRELTYPKVADLPGVTRGEELLYDGAFNAGMGAWTDVDSDPDCGVNWVSDGAGGGYLQNYSTGPGAEMPAARLKRRLDIMEIGETYELKQTGRAGSVGTMILGAAPTDGGYFSPSARYLAPAQAVSTDEVTRQFVARSETLFLGYANSYPGLTLDNVSLKRVITPAP